MENAGPGSRDVENTGSGGKTTSSGGKHGIWWKTRGQVENTESGGKHGIWWKNPRGLV